MSESHNERLALARHINKLWYEGDGWLKTIPFDDLQRQLDAANRQLIDSYREAAAPDLDLRRSVIRVFLREWLMCNLPEHIGTWGLEPHEFHPISPEQATSLADEIVSTASEARVEEGDDGLAAEWRPRILARMPWYQSGEDQPHVVVDSDDPGDVPVIPYSQLREWFPRHLFDPAAVAFFAHTSPGGPTVRFNQTRPRLLGMDRELIGMLWLEN